MKNLLIYLILLSAFIYGCDPAGSSQGKKGDRTIPDSEVVKQIKKFAGSYGLALDTSELTSGTFFDVDTALTVAASGNDVLIHVVEEVEPKEGEVKTPQVLCTLFSNATLDEDLNVTSKNVQSYGAINNLNEIDRFQLRTSWLGFGDEVVGAEIDYKFSNVTDPNLEAEDRVDSGRSFEELKSECLNYVAPKQAE